MDIFLRAIDSNFLVIGRKKLFFRYSIDKDHGPLIANHGGIGIDDSFNRFMQMRIDLNEKDGWDEIGSCCFRSWDIDSDYESNGDVDDEKSWNVVGKPSVEMAETVVHLSGLV